MKQVESDSRGKVRMGPGTLYGSIRRMTEWGFICESDKKIDPNLDDERRVYYRITALGRQTLAAELQRYRQVVAVARERSLLPKATVLSGVAAVVAAVLQGASNRRRHKAGDDLAG